MMHLKRQQGQTAVETVLMVPLLLLLFFLIFEIGRTFFSWIIITNSAREGARLAVVEPFTPPEDSINRIRVRASSTAEPLTVAPSACTGSDASCVDVAPPADDPDCTATPCNRIVTVVVRYRLDTLMPISGTIPFLGPFNYPGFVEVVGVSTMRWE
ncbi:MAG: pilus assembly protein [Armatimonadota bacterium]|nr:pilus assembly protein [Armatimonadota bacterium]